jgi:hypothetical protein
MAAKIISLENNKECHDVDGDAVRSAVVAMVDFHIPIEIYVHIDHALAEIWRQTSDTINTGDMHMHVENYFRKSKILYPFSKLHIIVDAVIEYLTIIGHLR